MAPETTIDFDAPHVSSRDVLLAFFGAFGFFGSVLAFVYISDPEARNPVARRSAVISNESFLYSVGLADSAPEHEE